MYVVNCYYTKERLTSTIPYKNIANYLLILKQANGTILKNSTD